VGAAGLEDSEEKGSLSQIPKNAKGSPGGKWQTMVGRGR
jgi:hypothetical protein